MRILSFIEIYHFCFAAKLLRKRNHCVSLKGQRQNLTCEEEEDEDHNQSVSKVEDGASSSNYLEL